MAESGGTEVWKRWKGRWDGLYKLAEVGQAKFKRTGGRWRLLAEYRWWGGCVGRRSVATGVLEMDFGGEHDDGLCGRVGSKKQERE